jgi:hypothetical protein
LFLTLRGIGPCVNDRELRTESSRKPPAFREHRAKPWRQRAGNCNVLVTRHEGLLGMGDGDWLGAVTGICARFPSGMRVFFFLLAQFHHQALKLLHRLFRIRPFGLDREHRASIQVGNQDVH